MEKKHIFDKVTTIRRRTITGGSQEKKRAHKEKGEKGSQTLFAHLRKRDEAQGRG